MPFILNPEVGKVGGPSTRKQKARQAKLAVWLGLLAILALAVGAVSAAQSLPSKATDLAGQVTNRITGRPVPMAVVRLIRDDAQQLVAVVFSDSAGGFQFKDLSPGNYRLSAERPEFQFVKDGKDSAMSGQPVVLHDGEELRNVRLQLAPLGVIAGTVFAEDGEPAPGVVIAAVLVNEKNGGSTSQVARTTTDDLGSYRLHGLPPGRYCVRIGARGRATDAMDDPPEARTFFYPHAQRQEQATVLNIREGSTLTGIDLTLPADRPIQDSTSQTTSLGESATIRGVVRNAATGDPVPRVHLTLLQGDDAQGGNLDTTSDGAGNFSFRSIAPGQYQLRATRVGFSANGSSSSSSAASRVAVAEKQTFDAADLKLMPLGVIAGRILEGNVSVSNAIVIAARLSRVAGKSKLALVSRTYSNDLGEYRLFDLPAGHYYIGVSYHGGMAPGSSHANASERSQEPPPREDYVTTFYPEAVDLADAVPLEVTPGSIQTSIDVALHRVRKLRVSGRVRFPTDVHAASSVTAALLPVDPLLLSKFSGQRVFMDHRTGNFRVDGVAPGQYVLAFDSRADDQYAASLLVNVAKTDIAGLDVTLSRSFQVRGRVTEEGSQSIANFSSLSISLQTSGAAGIRNSASGSVNADGSFRIQNLRPDRYSLRLSGLKDDCYLKTVSLGMGDAPATEITLVDGSPTLELVLRTDGGSIAGKVIDDRHTPIRSATVVLIPEPPLRDRVDLYRHISTNSEGEFTLRGIAPGEYKLFAWDKIEDNAYLDEDALFEDLGQRVSVQEGSKGKVELTIISNDGKGR
jgi:hypothetical protein